MAKPPCFHLRFRPSVSSRLRPKHTGAQNYPRPLRAAPTASPPSYPERELTYLGNVFNAKARDFLARHGVELIADAFEANREKGAVSLMITKHCLRYSYNLCPKEVKGLRPDPMTLKHGKEILTLSFDCKRCEMHVVGKLGAGALRLHKI